jgi:hypothetical protein
VDNVEVSFRMTSERFWKLAAFTRDGDWISTLNGGATPIESAVFRKKLEKRRRAFGLDQQHRHRPAG